MFDFVHKRRFYIEIQNLNIRRRRKGPMFHRTLSILKVPE